ncbi:MAG: adenylosuccinate lyase [Gammaproteobacteria bacterium]
MDLSTLTALSPLDGRYAEKTEPLRRYLSEFALIRYRVLVEVRWLQHLADTPGVHELEPLSRPVKDVLNGLVDEFSLQDAQRVKDHEKVTNHDVKAVEYFLRDACRGLSSAAGTLSAFLHFACTSEDINNLAYALMLRDARRHVLLPQMKAFSGELRARAHRFADIAMLSRTHGQTASPTTLGKELANFVARYERQTRKFEAVEIFGKCNGAVGNFNAHVAAYPDIDWAEIGAAFVESLGLQPQRYTTQIEPHDWISEYSHALMRCDTVLLDFSRDVWGYVSLGYFRSRLVDGEVGSSTMPHKVNPIDFENAEGNLGIADALLGHLAAKLPVSRWQRDLSDSTALRTLGAAIGHSYLALISAGRGLAKLDADPARIAEDLDKAWEVLGEAIQTVLRKHGVEDAYEQLKSLTRGREITQSSLRAFLAQTPLPDSEKARLVDLVPGAYTGIAARLAGEV